MTSTTQFATDPVPANHRSRRIAAGVASLAILGTTVVVGLGLGGDPASAATYARYRVAGTGGSGVSARTSPTVPPGSGYGAPENAEFGVRCQVIGEPFGPRGNTLYLLSEYDGRVFYIPDYYTSSPHLAGQPPIAGIPMCGQSPGPAQGSSPVIQGSSPCLQNCGSAPQAASTPASRAVAWALTQEGRAYATPDVANAYSAADWAPGNPGEWSGDCLRFVYHAYRVAGGPSVVTAATAYQSYLRYRSMGRVKTNGTPPAGALVFWTAGLSAGHVAISLGGGNAIGTNGVDRQERPVTRYPVNGRFSGYLGYVIM